jgi:hypothetical protein
MVPLPIPPALATCGRRGKHRVIPETHCAAIGVGGGGRLPEVKGATVGCMNALNINPNTFLSFFLYLFILFRSYILQTCTNYASDFFLNFFYFIGPEN